MNYPLLDRRTDYQSVTLQLKAVVADVRYYTH